MRRATPVGGLAASTRPKVTGNPQLASSLRGERGFITCTSLPQPQWGCTQPEVTSFLLAGSTVASLLTSQGRGSKTSLAAAKAKAKPSKRKPSKQRIPAPSPSSEGSVRPAPPPPPPAAARRPASKKSSAAPPPLALWTAPSSSAVAAAVDPRRCRLLTTDLQPVRKENRGKTVIYWMSRDQRVQDNWALLRARDIAVENGGALMVVFCLVPTFLDATLRQFDFMLRGLAEVEQQLQELKIPFRVLTCEYGTHGERLRDSCVQYQAGTVVCDLSPLRVPREWVSQVTNVLEAAGVACEQVDAHNVVPVWLASDKEERMARWIRKKLTSQYESFLVEFPLLEAFSASEDAAMSSSELLSETGGIDWESLTASLKVDRTVLPVEHVVPGSAAARRQLEKFCRSGLSIYAGASNDPNKDALSGLSPYLHFGQISAQRCALDVSSFASATSDNAIAIQEGAESFLEQVIIRRELADNFCWYNEQYDSLQGAREWAVDTLEDHAGDKREYLYTLEDFETANTHDPLWNASQLQMVREGKMHGYVRMYWAKKILEWSPSPEEALRIAIYLNDRYELDGRDPNGYVGVMWSIAGTHDQGWKERPVFGKIRYMTYKGCKSKFDVAKFESRYVA